MLTIATIFDEFTNEKTKTVWDELEAICSLSGILTAPFPHFTWQSSLGYPMVSIKNRIDIIANQISVFNVKTTGIGIFSGISPIIFLPIVKTKLLIELHEIIWEELAPYAEKNNLHYAPDNWIPHITLAIGDVNPENVACAIKQLAFLDLSLEIPVNNISLLSKIDNRPQINYVKHISEEGEL